MGVVNVTPDSFSDGGQWLDPDVAIAHGRLLVEQGADIVDVGGESTRPGATPVRPEMELERVLPVVRTLASEGVPVSVDTLHAVTAAACVEAGAVIVNDVSGGLVDPEVPGVIAGSDAGYVVGHWRGALGRMHEETRYEDVVTEVCAELAERLDAAIAAGVPAERIVLDPGLGFAKEPEHNWALLAAVGRLADLGQPVLVGASRKRFLGTLLAGHDGSPAGLLARDRATAAVTALAAAAGVWGVRVHDVPGSRDAVRVAEAWHRAGGRVRDAAETTPGGSVAPDAGAGSR